MFLQHVLHGYVMPALDQVAEKLAAQGVRFMLDHTSFNPALRTTGSLTLPDGAHIAVRIDCGSDGHLGVFLRGTGAHSLCMVRRSADHAEGDHVHLAQVFLEGLSTLLRNMN